MVERALMAMCCLVAVLGATRPARLPAQERRVVVGSVVGSAGAPIPGVVARLMGSFVAETTSSGGVFAIAPGSSGHKVLMLSKVGFVAEAHEIDVLPDTTTLAFQLQESPRALAPVVIKGEALNRSLAKNGFYDRRAESTAPRSQFVTRADIDKANPTRVSEMLNHMGVRARSCTAGRVFVDGVLTTAPSVIGGRLYQKSQEIGISRDAIDFLKPDEIEGMEVYAGAGQTPSAFNITALPQVKAGCVILIWSRR